MKKAYNEMIELVYGGNTAIQYSGRGIIVCNEWKESLTNFSDDMGEMPKGATLERKDKNKGFNKTNCFWHTIKPLPVNEIKANTTKLEKALEKTLKNQKIDIKIDGKKHTKKDNKN